METFELGNLEVALLASPDSAEERSRLQTKLNKLSFQKLKQHDPAEAAEVLRRRAGRRFISTFRGDLTSHRIRERLDQRMTVARLFRSHVRNFLRDEAPALPPGLTRYSLKQLSAYVVPPDDPGSENFSRRWLKQTLPILHLAIAFDIFTCRLIDEQETRVELDVFDEATVTGLMYWSIRLEPFALNNPLRSVDPASIIGLRPPQA